MRAINGGSAIYRIFDADGTLLYIGISADFGTRWKQHARIQPWWPAARHMTVTWLGRGEDAEDAERAAIRTEKPSFNRTHNRVAVAPAGENSSPAMERRIAVGRWIRKRRIASGLAQRELALKMQDAGFRWHQNTLARMENGNQALLFREALALSEIFEVPINSFAKDSA